MRCVNSFIRVFLLTAGIVPRKGLIILNILLCLTIVALHLTLIVGEYIAFVSPIDSIYRIEILYQTLCFIYIGSTEFISWYNRNILLKIYSKICDETMDVIDYKVWCKMETAFRKIMKIFVAVYFFSIMVYISAPLMNFLRHKNFSDPLSYPLPYWFCIWQINSTTEYVYMNATQNIVCVTIFFIYACSFGFILCVTLNCWIHMKELKSRIENLGSRKHSRVEELEQVVEYAEAELRLLIKHQQKLRSFIADVSKYLENIFSMTIAWFMMVTLLTTFMTTQIVSDFVFKMKIASVISNVVGSFFFFCVIAESLSNMNETIRESFYNNPWYIETTRFQKLILISVSQTRKIEIKAFGMYKMNLELFTVALRTIYSLLNIILLSLKKKSQ